MLPWTEQVDHGASDVEPSHTHDPSHSEHYRARRHQHLTSPYDYHQHDYEGFEGDYAHERHEVEDYDAFLHHFEDEDRHWDHRREEHEWYQMYEDPHVHAPLREERDLRGHLAERRPTDSDFYTFDWKTLHDPETLHERHLVPHFELTTPHYETSTPKAAAEKPSKPVKVTPIHSAKPVTPKPEPVATPAPVAKPTPAPIAKPTPAPVAKPKPAPVASPKPAPVAALAPTPAPTPKPAASKPAPA